MSAARSGKSWTRDRFCAGVFGLAGTGLPAGAMVNHRQDLLVASWKQKMTIDEMRSRGRSLVSLKQAEKLLFPKALRVDVENNSALVGCVLEQFQTRVPGPIFLAKALLQLDQQMVITGLADSDERLAWSLQQGHWLKMIVSHLRTVPHHAQDV